MGWFDWFLRLVNGTPAPPTKPRSTPAAPSQTALPPNRSGADTRTPSTPVDTGWTTTRNSAAPVDPMTPSRPAPTPTAATSPTTSATRFAATPPAPPPAPPADLGAALNLGSFIPLTSEQAKQQAENAAWSPANSQWFGRQDIVPPASDPRTNIIDRAMVGQGLTTPEELAELHRIGDEYGKYKPELYVADQLGRQAAEQARNADAAERAEIKARKQAESAEKKRKHAAAVAQRKATEIVFLGRGVSGGLTNHTGDIARLRKFQLPVLTTPEALATALDLEVPQLRWLAFHSEAATRTHYIRFTVPKKSGGVRELSCPHRKLAARQETILRTILAKVPTHAAAHGFIAGRSTATNAAPHQGKAVVVNLDLKDFFPSITFPRVRGVFKRLGYSPSVATILALLCTESPRKALNYDGKVYYAATGPRALPQGACTSPALSNLLTYKLDARLAGIAAKAGWTYTRYADDITFSADAEALPLIGKLLARVRHVVQEEGFAVNEDKTRVQRRNVRQSVTGVVVNDRLNAPRTIVRRLRAILHAAKSTGLAAQNRESRDDFEGWLQGMIAYVQMLNPEHGAALKAQFDSVRSSPG